MFRPACASPSSSFLLTASTRHVSRRGRASRAVSSGWAGGCSTCRRAGRCSRRPWPTWWGYSSPGSAPIPSSPSAPTKPECVWARTAWAPMPAVWRQRPQRWGFRRQPPVLAVEVAGQDEDADTLREKARWYLGQEVPVVWIVLPGRARGDRGHRRGRDASRNRRTAPHAPGACPGFSRRSRTSSGRYPRAERRARPPAPPPAPIAVPSRRASTFSYLGVGPHRRARRVLLRVLPRRARPARPRSRAPSRACGPRSGPAPRRRARAPPASPFALLRGPVGR